ncbi:hypothetical protein [Candidatus Methylomicrobium oryzae]|jgi:hypothetical protein|uniref:hypothetical protein n=1 Tax=Candidatus Methylomicrobium oryzae TaxID=2802053 RepID=UPI001923CE9B|nr:hypothetical protein [Methylomicrobium sp. RS1]MBL1263624.1 hypothetical protein [Methylomicrobium sp. RS1]
MPVDPRDQLWIAVYETYYQSYYQEILSDALLTRWQRFDDLTKLIVALTASSSAVAGLVAYFSTNNNLNITWLWPVLSGIAALFAICHKEMAVQYRLRDHSDNMKAFSSLRLDLETFRSLIQIEPEFPIDEFKKTFEEFRKRYSEEYRRLRIDSFLTDGLRETCQAELNRRITTTTT